MMAFEIPPRRMREGGEFSLHLRHATRTENKRSCGVSRILSCAWDWRGTKGRVEKGGDCTAYQQSVPVSEIAARVHAGFGGSAGPRVHPHLRSCITHRHLISAHGS